MTLPYEWRYWFDGPIAPEDLDDLYECDACYALVQEGYGARLHLQWHNAEAK